MSISCTLLSACKRGEREARDKHVMLCFQSSLTPKVAAALPRFCFRLVAAVVAVLHSTGPTVPPWQCACACALRGWSTSRVRVAAEGARRPAADDADLPACSFGSGSLLNAHALPACLGNNFNLEIIVPAIAVSARFPFGLQPSSSSPRPLRHLGEGALELELDPCRTGP